MYGNWATASEMCTVTGANAVGDEATFQYFVNSVVFNTINTQIFSMSDINSYGDNFETISSINAGKKIYKKLFFRNKNLVGGLLMNDTRKSVGVMKAVQSGKMIADLLKEEILM